MTDPAKQIPLRDRAGNVRAWTIVDAADFDRLNDRRWFLSADGYAIWHDKAGGGRTVYLHRVVLGLERWSVDRREVDHINHDRLDNRRTNLRVVQRKINGQNILRPHQKTSSPYRGVYWYAQKQRWRAKVMIDGRDAFCRTFRTELDAAIAAESFRLEHMPGATPDPVLARALER